MLHQNHFFKPDPASKNMFYLEFSPVPSLDGQEKYCFHLSFGTKEVAERMFKLMNEQWGLPVIIEDNRIMVQPAINPKSPGVYLHSSFGGADVMDYVGIRFQHENHAKDFFNFAKPTIENKKNYFSIPNMTCNFGCIYFNKYDLIQSKYLIDERAVQAHHINVMICALHQAFFSHARNASNDIVCYLMKLLIMHEAGNPDSYFNRFVELNKQFALQKQKLLLPEQKQKMNVSVKGITPDSTNEYSLYLSCETPQQTAALIDHLQKCNMKSEKIFGTMVRIQPGIQSHMGTLPGVFWRGTSEISIGFYNEIDKYKFFQSVQIANVSYQSSLDDNRILFQKDSLPEIKLTHANYFFDKNNISFTCDLGTHVHIKDVSDYCCDWLNSLPLQNVVFFEGCQIFKVNDYTVSFGSGKGQPGIQLKSENGGLTVCNNMPADEKFTSFDERKAHLQSKLYLLDKIIDSNKQQCIQTHVNNPAPKQEDKQEVCTIS